MADNVLEIGSFKLYRERRNADIDPAQGGKHASLQMEHGEVVRCKDCGVQVSTWFALRSLAAQWQECVNKVQRERAAAEAIIKE